MVSSLKEPENREAGAKGLDGPVGYPEGCELRLSRSSSYTNQIRRVGCHSRYSQRRYCSIRNGLSFGASVSQTNRLLNKAIDLLRMRGNRNSELVDSHFGFDQSILSESLLPVVLAIRQALFGLSSS